MGTQSPTANYGPVSRWPARSPPAEPNVKLRPPREAGLRHRGRARSLARPHAREIMLLSSLLPLPLPPALSSPATRQLPRRRRRPRLVSCQYARGHQLIRVGRRRRERTGDVGGPGPRAGGCFASKRPPRSRFIYNWSENETSALARYTSADSTSAHGESGLRC